MVARRSSDVETLTEALLRLLPEDGTPVLNRVMRVMLARKLERAIDQDGYFAGREHVKYEMRSALQSAAGELTKGLGAALGGTPARPHEKRAPARGPDAYPITAKLERERAG